MIVALPESTDGYRIAHPSRRGSTLRMRLLMVLMGILGVGSFRMIDPIPAAAEDAKKASPSTPAKAVDGLEKATFGSGCFWCTEAVFQQLKGVKSVVSGYSGGKTKNPTYEEVCTGNSGHAEVIQVTYDPKIVSYPELLEVFWKTHDPTTLNQQGADRGTQYRSVIFFHNEPQQKLADEYLKKLDASGVFDAPIVTEISPLKEFYPGEKYHQNYFRNNPDNPYCTAVIKRKVAKFRAVFKDKLKETGSP